MKRLLFVFILVLFAAQPALGARAKIDTLSADPYLSALVIDADSGKMQDTAHTRAYFDSARF